MLDATRDLLLSDGAQSATIEAIALASGAPSGSIYHRFGSRNELVARLWIRAVYRSQAAFLVALEHPDAKAAALAAGTSIVEFCEQHPQDARLLASFRRDDLVRALPDGALAEELKELNRPVERALVDLARRLYGKRTRAALDRTMLCVLDLPYGAAQRYLKAGQPLPRGLREDLERAIEAVLDRPLNENPPNGPPGRSSTGTAVAPGTGSGVIRTGAARARPSGSGRRPA